MKVHLLIATSAQDLPASKCQPALISRVQCLALRAHCHTLASQRVKNPVASRLAFLAPAISVQFADHLSNLHDVLTVERLWEIET